MLGIAEHKDGFHRSLNVLGKSDNKGRTIAISYVNGTAFRLISLAARLSVFVLFALVLKYRQPLVGILPAGGPTGYESLRNWEIFSLATWGAGLFIYLVYFLFSLIVKNGLYRGEPGVEMHFTRYGKIVYTVKPGEAKFIVDPRVQPFAVVSTKPMVLEMPVVENNTRDNMVLKFRGALVIRVKDTLRLLQAGGFKNFIRQLEELYTSRMRDEIQRVDAEDFNRFYVEPVRLPSGANASRSITERLEELSRVNLSVEVLEKLATIDEMDMSKLDLVESPNPERRNIIPRLQGLANDYGVEIIDHVPVGNRTSDEYLHTLALPLVSSITRITQATDMLREIRQNEIEVDIGNHVAARQMLVLEIQKIINTIKSVKRTLDSGENRQKLTTSRRQTMTNITESILAVQLSKIEALLARTKASGVDLANLDLLVRSTEDAFKLIEGIINQSLPAVGAVVTDSFDRNAIVPDIDVVDAVLEGTGLKQQFLALEAQRPDTANAEELLMAFEREAKEIDVAKVLQEIEAALTEISSNTGVSTVQYTPESVERIIQDLEAKSAQSGAKVETAVLATATV